MVAVSFTGRTQGGWNVPGCDGADIDLSVCETCFAALREPERWRLNAAVARRYGMHDKAAEYERKATQAAAGQ